MSWMPGDSYRIALFYRYVYIPDVPTTLSWLRGLCEKYGLLGRILVSTEGINGTLAGGLLCVESFVQILSGDDRFANIDWKFTDDSGGHLPFLGLSIREVDEIISCGRAKQFINSSIDFKDETYGGIVGTGTHLTPEQFHEAIARKDGIILDIRNEFEFDIGHFDGSTNLKTFNYAETFDVLDELLPAPITVPAPVTGKRTTGTSAQSISPAHVEKGDIVENAPSQCTSSHQLKEAEVTDANGTIADQNQNVYMYCTGGIRCEKASAYLCAKGYKNVFQLEGGIHRYLEAYPDGGLFQGKNFVFDSRVAVSPPAAALSSSPTVSNEQKDSPTHTPTQASCSEKFRCTNSSSNSSDTTSQCNRAATASNLNDVEHQVSTDGGGGGIAVNRREAVVGKCIDCSSPHDAYSGHIVCTVCRMPVLVCPNCVQNSSTPGEYHCVRHRDLKHLYFTVLTRFSAEELTKQLDGSLSLEKDSATLLDKIKQHERIRRRRAASALHRSDATKTHKEDDVKEISQLESLFEEEEEEVVGGIDERKVADGLSKQRRRTLRKQIERVEKQIHILHCGAKEEDSDLSDIINPKTRGGWGFWKT